MGMIEFMADMALEREMRMVSRYWSSVMQWNIVTNTCFKRQKNKLASCVSRLVTDRKDEVFEADNVESKWNAMKEVWQKATEQSIWVDKRTTEA